MVSCLREGELHAGARTGADKGRDYGRYLNPLAFEDSSGKTKQLLQRGRGEILYMWSSWEGREGVLEVNFVNIFVMIKTI